MLVGNQLVWNAQIRGALVASVFVAMSAGCVAEQGDAAGDATDKFAFDGSPLEYLYEDQGRCRAETSRSPFVYSLRMREPIGELGESAGKVPVLALTGDFNGHLPQGWGTRTFPDAAGQSPGNWTVSKKRWQELPWTVIQESTGMDLPFIVEIGRKRWSTKHNPPVSPEEYKFVVIHQLRGASASDTFIASANGRDYWSNAALAEGTCSFTAAEVREMCKAGYHIFTGGSVSSHSICSAYFTP